MKKHRLLALALVLMLCVSVLPLQALAADAGAVTKGDFSFFAGTYSAYSQFVGGYGGGKPLPDLTLSADGTLSGKVTSYSPAMSIKPTSVTKNSDGSYTCLVRGSVGQYGFTNGSEGYVLYPVGVAEPTYNLPTDVVRLKYVICDGGILEIVYHNTTAPQGNGVNKPVPTAYASTQNVDVNGKPVEFQAYALKDEHGNDTNYIKLRDVAYVLNGTGAQFNVNWNGTTVITTGESYKPTGSEMKTPYSGNQPYEDGSAPLIINGKQVNINSIVLHDSNGGGYTYFKLRDLGAELGFTVDWEAGKGIFIKTGDSDVPPSPDPDTPDSPDAPDSPDTKEVSLFISYVNNGLIKNDSGYKGTVFVNSFASGGSGGYSFRFDVIINGVIDYTWEKDGGNGNLVKFIHYFDKMPADTASCIIRVTLEDSSGETATEDVDLLETFKAA